MPDAARARATEAAVRAGTTRREPSRGDDQDAATSHFVASTGLGEAAASSRLPLDAAAGPAPSFVTGTAARWLLAGLVCLAMLPALLWCGAGMLLARQDLIGAAYGAAHGIERALARQARFAGPQLQAALDVLEAPPAWQFVAVSDAKGATLASRGDARAAAWPSLGLRVPLHRHGAPAFVHARLSLWPLAWSSLTVLAVCAALAWGLWRMARRSAIGALRQVQGKLRAIGTRDVLTGLLNREGLRQRLQRRMSAPRTGARRLGVLVVDVDRFRLVNESFGQQAGNLLLREVAQRLREVTSREASLARLGDDQFALLVERAGSTQALLVLARNLLRAFEQPLRVGAQQTATTVSIGVAVADEEVASVDALLTNADAALRAAKARGGSRYCLYESSMGSDAPRRLAMELRLRRALQAQEFFLAYQPIVDASGTRIVTVEALLRWADPQHGLVPPSEFIAVLEQTGLIVPVGSWVLREACTRARRWLAGGASELVLSVNVSPLQFAEPDYVTSTLRTLDATGFPPQQLQLELTEGLLVDPTPATLRKMDELADAGVRLAVDDFGIGYSSMAYLKRFRLRTLKVDRLFVSDVAQSASDAAIVRAIVELGHGLGLHVCAEGVETVAQWQRLRQLGCDSMQGFLFARPGPPEDVQTVLQRSPAAASAAGAPMPLAVTPSKAAGSPTRAVQA